MKAGREHGQKAKMSVFSLVRKLFFSLLAAVARPTPCRLVRWTWVDGVGILFLFFLSSRYLPLLRGQGKNARKARKRRTYRSVSFEGTDDLDVILCVCIRSDVRLVSYLISTVTEL